MATIGGFNIAPAISGTPVNYNTGTAAANLINKSGGSATTVAGGSVLGPYSYPTPVSGSATSGSTGGVLGTSTKAGSGTSAPAPTPQPYTDPYGGIWANQDAFNNAINAAYQPSYDYLNQAEGAVRSDLPTTLNAAQQNYDVNSAQLGDQHDSLNRQIGQQTDQAGYQNESALAASRRLYSELNMGYNARFGGATSAGDAAHELANVEQQRQMGQQNRSYQDTLTTLGNKHLDLDNNYQTGMLQLQQQKQTAIDQANRDFQNKLLTINQNRADLSMDKGNQSLQALQDLRNKVYQIGLQNTQFEQTLAAQKQAAALQLQNYAALGYTSTNAAQNAVSQFGQQYQNPTSAYGVTNQQGPAVTQNYLGALGYKKDANGNYILG